jgi:hypothetical protein
VVLVFTLPELRRISNYFAHEHTVHALLLSSDLKVDVHRKNSSESSEEMATLRPVVEKVSVHRAEQCTQADHEHFRTKLQGNPPCSVVFHYKHNKRVMTCLPKTALNSVEE